MRVLIVIRALKVGGIERVASILADTYAKNGHECHLLYFKEKKHPIAPESSDVILHQFNPSKTARKKAGGLLIELASRIINIFVRKGYFIPFGWYGGKLFKEHVKKLESTYGAFDSIIFRGIGAYESMWSFRDTRAIFVIENVLNYNDSFLGKLKARLLFSKKKIATVSEGVKEDLLANASKLSFNPQSVKVITNPCPVESIHKLMTEKDPDIPGQEYIINVARLVPQKNHKLLLDAYALTKKTYPLVIVGDGPLMNELKEHATNLNINHLVTFTGEKKNPFPLMHHAKLFVLSSVHEGLGIVLLESLACNTPVISTDSHGGVRDIFNQGLEGYLCPPDAQSLASLIDSTLDDGCYEPDNAILDKYRPDNIANEFLNYAKE